MTHRNIKDGVRIRRSIYIAPALAQRLDALVSQGAIISNIISVSLSRALPTIEKNIGAGKQIPGLRVKRGK